MDFFPPFGKVQEDINTFAQQNQLFLRSFFGFFFATFYDVWLNPFYDLIWNVFVFSGVFYSLRLHCDYIIADCYSDFNYNY